MEVKDNILFEGMSGKMLGMVFYNRYGKTFARKSAGSYNKVPTEKQATVRQRFLAANAFAKYIISDPVLKAEYKKKAKKHRNAYTTAMSEYFVTHK